jgi:hypothetical protein
VGGGEAGVPGKSKRIWETPTSMASRPLIIATLVGASVGVPYLTSKSPDVKNATTSAPAKGSIAPQNGSLTRLPIVTPPVAPLSPQVPGQPNAVTRVPLNGTQFTSIDQVLRFDVSKEWVYQNWDRKSTGPTDVGLFSVRVPLVMKPQVYALAGSLTYYFNGQGQVEHISFRGRTGDSTQLVQLLVSRYQFQRVASPTGEQVYQVQHDGQVQSELRTHPESVLWLKSPNQSVSVELELARPGSIRVLPPRPTGFESLQAAQTQQAAAQAAQASAEKATSAAESSKNSYLNKVRYATPAEESQVIWQRWPN